MLKLQTNPKPTDYKLFLTQTGGIYLQHLKCLHNNLKGCSCRYYKIMKNKSKNKIFIVIYCFHDINLLKTDFVVTFNDKKYNVHVHSE